MAKLLRLALIATLAAPPLNAQEYRDAVAAFRPFSAAGVDLPPTDGYDLQQALSRGVEVRVALAHLERAKQSASPEGRRWLETHVEPVLRGLPLNVIAPAIDLSPMKALPQEAPQARRAAAAAALQVEAQEQADRLAGVPLKTLVAAAELPAAKAAPVIRVEAKPFRDPDLDRLRWKEDLAGPGKTEELSELDALIRKYEGLLGESPEPGHVDSVELRHAALEALKGLFGKIEDAPKPEGPSRPETPEERRVREAVERVVAVQTELQGQVGARDAAAAMLAVADRVRAAALRERRAGREMLEFRKNFSRLAMVMDLSYSLNLINNAEKALTGMQSMLDAKLARIDEQRKRNDAGGAAAEELRRRSDEWRKEAEEAVKSDKDRAADFGKLSDKAAVLSRRIEEFRAEVSGLLATIDARDKGKSAGALAEYDRRLALLPALHRKLVDGEGGGPGEVTALSLKYLREQSSQVEGYLRQLSDADARLAGAPLEFAGALVIVVPGIPAVGAYNPQAPEVLRILSERREHWKLQQAEHQKLLDSVDASLDPSSAKRVANDFGDSVPESLVVYQREQRELAASLGRAYDDLARQADELAARVEAGAPGASLPRLTGRSGDELRELLPAYVDELHAMSFADTDAGYDAKMDKLALVKLLPFLGDLTIRRLEADATVEALEKPVKEILPEARARFTQSVAALKAVVDDVGLDEAFVKNGGDRQALIDRKRALLRDKLKPMLEAMRSFLDDTLIPLQQDRIKQADPTAEGDSLAVLYKEKKNLYAKIDESLKKSLPWGLASGGAPEGNVSAARAEIEKTRKTFTDYKDIVRDYQDQMRRRKDPNNAEVEDTYGEPAPYSLVRRQAKYQAEKNERAGQINARAGEVMKILADMDKLEPKYNLAARYKLPTDVKGDEGPARLRKLADDRVLQDMAADIRRIADEAAAAGSPDLSVGGGDGGLPGSGVQPPVTLAKNQQLALLGLEAVKRLVPTTATGAKGDSIAECLARFLFADALVSSSKLNLEERIPMFEKFLSRGDAVLDEALADLDADSVWVGGDLSGGRAVLERKTGVYKRIATVAREGAELFGTKAGWSAEGIETVADVSGYYATVGEVYGSGNEALDAEAKAAREMKDALKKKLDELREQKTTVAGWLKQLNDPHESALRRVMDNVSAVQDKTRAVLEANIDYHAAEKQFKAADGVIKTTLEALAKEQAALTKALEGVGDLGRLDPELAKKVRSVSPGGSGWLAAGGAGPQTIVIPKSHFATFLTQLFAAFEPESSARDIAALRDEILKNPLALSQLLPGSRMVEMGEGADGFYLVYQTEFSTPHGLESTAQVTMGNVLKLGGSNVSVIGHRFASPPDPVNAPFGDQGITVRVESLQGANWVNYLDVTFHKFIQDIPRDLTVGSQAQEARMMVFDDFALMLANGKLYFGAAGFADFAVQDPKDKPYYYGGNLKASVKFTEIMSLNAEESLLFAKDPRRFLQTVNLDFTKYDPDLDKDWVISAEGENKTFRRDKVGVGFDLQKALEGKDAFKVDFYVAQVSGTDDIAQRSAGASVIKGFAFDLGGVPVQTTLTGGAELGERYDTYNGRVSFNLPNQGLVLSAQGKLLGDAGTYFLELRKKMGANTDLFASYGSPYVGLNHRLTIGANTTFTLGELWRAVAGGAADALTGDEALKKFNKRLEDFFAEQKANQTLLAELERVYASDVGKRLLSLEIGALSRDLQELARAGAFLDNTRQRAMIGFVTNPVHLGTAERASGGGFQIGSQTEMTLTKTQRALIEQKTASIYAAGAQLQLRLLDLTKLWQRTLADAVLARWELALAGWTLANSSDPVLKAEAQTRLADARGRLRQALLRYNALTGRGPDEGLPFDALSPADLDALLTLIGKALEQPNRLSRLLERARPEVKEPGFNLLDWIPWVERLTFVVGAQLQDVLSSQALGVGFSVRLPVHDPASRHGDKALRLSADATLLELAGTARKTKLKARSEAELARSRRAQAERLAASTDEVVAGAADAVRAGRNGLMPQHEVWEKLRRWHWTVSSHLEARVEASLAEAWAILYGDRPDDWSRSGPADLASAYESALRGSESLEALALRSQAAGELLEAADRRYAKVTVDVNVGANVTAAGIALIPAFGLTGLGVFPVLEVNLNPEELRQLSVERRQNEQGLYARLGDKVAGDTAVELFRQYAEWKAAGEAVALYDARLPGLAGWARDRALLERADAEARQRTAAAALNHLMGRPLGARIELKDDLEAALAGLERRLAELGPVAASRDVLASRLAVARAVEQVIDKNLRTQHIRLDPVSLIGRSLGRLVSALSGEGLASPELLALARHQVLQAERDLLAFDRNLPAARARLAFELEQARRELEAATDPIAISALRHRVLGLRAARAALGGGEQAAYSARLPSSWEDLRDKLREAFAAAAPSPDYGRPGEAMGSESLLEANGTLRWYYAKQSLSKEPIGKHFIEGWIEARLRSAATPPEALMALAHLQEQKAAELRGAQLSKAQADADMLLARLALRARLSPGDPRLQRDLRSAAARLGLGSDADILSLLPLEEGDGLDALAQRYLRDAESLDLEVIRRLVFMQGDAPEKLPQLRANLIAERMSYKGFTPVAAFGLFRGVWVGAGFLEAPDPQRIQNALENILVDALRRELEQQDRLKLLALKLHGLMASVSDKISAAEAHRARLQIARRNLAGAAVRVEMGLAPKADLAAAQDEAVNAHEDFVAVLFALRMDFISLVTELQALGHEAVPSSVHGAVLRTPERAREPLLAWWSRKLLDEGFEVPAGLEEAVRRYRAAAVDAHAVKQATGASTEEKLRALIDNDLQGRRLEVEAALSRYLDEAQKDPARWTALMTKLRSAVEADSRQAGAAVVDLRELRRRMDKAMPMPPAYAKLAALEDEAWAARDEALAKYLENELKPEDYVLRDKALERYVRALVSFDEEVAKALASGLDPAAVRTLSAVFDLRSSLKRRRDLLRHGRGLVTLDAALSMGESRLRALAWSLDDPRELGAASEQVAFLRDLRRRWVGRPDAVESLLLVKNTGQWVTEKELEGGRVVEAGGKRWLLPDGWLGKRPATLDELKRAGASELLEGADARRDRVRVEERRAAELEERRKLDAALATSEFALAGGRTVDLDELRLLEKLGRVLWFDRRGLALPAVAARHRRPDEVTAYVQVDGPAEPAGRYPTEGSLPKDRWRKLELGRLGAQALLKEAREDELASRRAGWLALKLEGYAFTLDEDGDVAAVYMDDKELPKDKPFHFVSELRLGLDAQGNVVEAQGRGFSLRFGTAAATRWIAGQPAALETDGRGRVARLFMDAAELEREAGSWKLEDTAGRLWDRTDKDLPPINRLRRYIDPKTGLGVSLGRSYLARRLAEAEDELGDLGRWAYMPRNWGNIVMELPRGIVKTPLELLTGRDPNQEGYIGRVYMYRGEGGATENHGAFGTIIRAIDVLELLPDPVDRYLDPSQFPSRVDLDSALKPGELMHEKDPDTRDGKKSVHYGQGSLLREVRYAREDREDARARIVGAFQGSVRREYLETTRGRAGVYLETTLKHETGLVAVDSALRQLGPRMGADGRARLSATPGGVAVDEIAATVAVQLGADQQRRRAAALEQYLETLPAPAAPDPVPTAFRLAARAAHGTIMPWQSSSLVPSSALTVP